MHADPAGTPELLAPTPRSRLVRRPALGRRDRATIEGILDESLVCHVGFVDAGAPVVLPACPWRIGDRLYLHGAAASRLFGQLSAGVPVCVSMALVDGLVLARAALRHSLHYRSVVLFGRCEAVTDPAAKARALHALVDKLSPGRADQVRPPSEAELAATAVAGLRIDEGCAKIAAAPPGEGEADAAVAAWAGVVSLRLATGGSWPVDARAATQPAPALPPWLRPTGCI